MTELDRVGNSDNFDFRGGSIVSASLREMLVGNAKTRSIECLHSDGSATYL